MSIGAILRRTKNYAFNIINFNFARWHGYEQSNWDLLDAILSSYITARSLKGIWNNSTVFAMGDRVIDDVTSVVYYCNVGHTSAVSGTFVADRALHPIYWTAETYAPRARGTWTTATSYSQNDFITFGTKYGVATAAFVSGASYDTDVTAGNIVTLIDVVSGLVPDGSVTTSKIVDAAVTLVKLQQIATATFLGRATAGTGSVEALSIAQMLSLLGQQVIATTAQFLANTPDKTLDTDGVWAGGAMTALADAATVAVDMGLGINFTLTLGGNRTLGAPTNTKPGQAGVIKILQDATGSRTLAYNSVWKFAGAAAPTLTTTANRTDLFYYFVESSTLIHASLVKDSR